ncbi:hypothetical protein SARC_14360, partial [Sphaeroforma arctica JP610]
MCTNIPLYKCVQTFPYTNVYKHSLAYKHYDIDIYTQHPPTPLPTAQILQKTLKTKLTSIKLAIPPRPREAVMVGAVMLGLKTHMTIKERVSVCAYGLRSTTTVVDKYPRHLHVFDATLRRTVVADVFATVVEKGQKLATGHKA